MTAGCQWGWEVSKALNSLVGSGYTTLLGSIDEELEKVAVLGFLRPQNECF